MTLTPEERRRIYEEERHRIEAEQQAPEAPRRGGGRLRLVALALGLFAVLLGFSLVTGRSSSTGTTTTTATDDRTLFIKQFGVPDSEGTTAFDYPRPPIPTRWLVYRAERVRVTYYPDVPEGTPPPYSHWKLLGLQDEGTDEVLSWATVRLRLAKRERQ
jgi:hypothetical protein